MRYGNFLNLNNNLNKMRQHVMTGEVQRRGEMSLDYVMSLILYEVFS